jgi:hypothetical protein
VTAGFSRRTWLSAINVIEENRYFTHAELTKFVIELGPEVYRAVQSEGVASIKRLNDLRVFIDDNPDYLTDGGPIAHAVVEKALSFIPRPTAMTGWFEPPPPTALQSRLLHFLNQDGYAVREGALISSLPADLGLPVAQTELFALLDRHDFPTPKSHLEQAIENHARGNWSSANGQLRNFFEGLLDEIAVRLDPAAANVRGGHDRRTRLSMVSPPFLSADLGEWSLDGKNFVNGLMKRLHPSGPHPGLSDEEDATFRLHIVLLTGRLLIARFDRRGS